MTEKLATIICKYCNTSVFVLQKDRKARYCSDRCKEASKVSKHLLTVSKRKPKGTYKFSEEDFASNTSITKEKYSKIYCSWCKKYYYIYTTLAKKYTTYCSKQCQDLKMELDLTNKSLPERNIYNKLIHACSYEQFKYLSFLLAKAKSRTKTNNRIFDITLIDLIDTLNKQQSKCALTGIDLTFQSNVADRYTASLDRINSNFGYIKSNIQFVCNIVNSMKSNLEQGEFIKLAKMISTHESC
jgi:endogenous inhibitor of DNA gyrase (YacG/DUF329 family)